MIEKLRNIAIIAHVDHGKTTLVDKLLQQSGLIGRKEKDTERIMDSNDQEKERGITILSKNTAIQWQDYRINIIDTPGHADFGGEVERALSMVDSALLLVDAVEGPMPQTRFVTAKAFAKGLNPILVINKVDCPNARCDWALDQVFDLFDRLGANDEQLDFPVIYASAIEGLAGPEPDQLSKDMTPLFQMIIDKVPYPQLDADGPFQMQICSLDYSDYLGQIGIGRVHRGKISPNQAVVVIDRKQQERQNQKILTIMGYLGLKRVEIEQASTGDIVCITGIGGLNISDTICEPKHKQALAPLSVDEPTVSMTFQVNDSPFAGKDGKYISNRNLKERLDKELLHNVALRVGVGESPDQFIVSGRGELHLSVLIESMRREGFELGVSRPKVITHKLNGKSQEPYENLVIDIEEEHQGKVMEELGLRKGELLNMSSSGQGRIRLEFEIPSRGLLGFRSRFATLTSGSGTLTHVFERYGDTKSGNIAKRSNGALISMASGKSLAYALFSLQARGRLFIGPNIEVYEGMIVGQHSRENDLEVNPTRAKQLTNMRASGSDKTVVLTPSIEHSLEQALEFIEDDELCEVTPNHIRLRKKFLTENERKRSARK